MALPMVDALPIVSSKYYHLLLTTYYLLGMALPMVNALPMALPMAESMPIVTAQFSPAGGVQSCMGDMGGGMPIVYTPAGMPVAEAVRI